MLTRAPPPNWDIFHIIIHTLTHPQYPPIFIRSLPFPLLSVFIHSTSPSSSSSNQRMCTNNTHMLPAYASKRNHRSSPKVQIYRLTRRRSEAKKGKDMQLKNIKLYLENQSIIEENKKLRKQAHHLHQENLALMSQFHQKFSPSNEHETVIS